jgi:hypothetical protein
MNHVIKRDGTIVEIEDPPRRGRPTKYPWSYLEVGDHFEAPWEAKESLRTKISALRKTGRQYGIYRGTRIGFCRVFREPDPIAGRASLPFWNV